MIVANESNPGPQRYSDWVQTRLPAEQPPQAQRDFGEHSRWAKEKEGAQCKMYDWCAARSLQDSLQEQFAGDDTLFNP